MNKVIYSKAHKHLASQLKKARVEAQLGQDEAAKLLEKTQSYISKVESGQSKIDIVELKEFAKIYNKTVSFFIE